MSNTCEFCGRRFSDGGYVNREDGRTFCCQAHYIAFYNGDSPSGSSGSSSGESNTTVVHERNTPLTAAEIAFKKWESKRDFKIVAIGIGIMILFSAIMWVWNSHSGPVYEEEKRLQGICKEADKLIKSGDYEKALKRIERIEWKYAFNGRFGAQSSFDEHYNEWEQKKSEFEDKLEEAVEDEGYKSIEDYMRSKGIEK